MQSEENKQLAMPVTDMADNNKTTSHDFYQMKNQRRPAAKRFAGKRVDSSSWIPILLFGSVVMTWVLYILLHSERHNVSSYPFLLMTFFLIAVSLIQIPVQILRQYRKDRESSGYIDDAKGRK